MLEAPEFAVGPAVIAQGRTARFDRLLQHFANRFDQGFGGSPRRALGVDERLGHAQRRKPGAVQRLADINVAEPGDSALVEERALERRVRGGKKRGEPRGVEFGRQRLDAEIAKQRMLG